MGVQIGDRGGGDVAAQGLMESVSVGGSLQP
jgi:hypothetical protein